MALSGAGICPPCILRSLKVGSGTRPDFGSPPTLSDTRLHIRLDTIDWNQDHLSEEDESRRRFQGRLGSRRREPKEQLVGAKNLDLFVDTDKE